MEIWKDISGFPGYQVSNLGRVKSKRQALKPIFNKTYKDVGYYRVKLSGGNIRYIHRLVAIAFLPNPDNKPTVNHKDSNKANNAASNLEWATVSENNQHAYDNGKRVPCGEQRSASKLTEAQANEIKIRIGNGERNGVVARAYSISPATVCDIIKERTWKHLKAA